ncbi:MAG: Ig-like domain-containing protein [Acidobacteria bacterium]|nr:Ig-like domain-containing protein [Acidobacteriota bacterium]
MKRLVSLILIINVYLGLIAPVGVQLNLQANAQTIRGKAKTTTMNQVLPNGLQFRLSEGEAGAETREKQLPAATNPLSENETGNLLKRLPQIKTDKDDQSDFAKRQGSLPAPKTGKMIPVKFPAGEERGTPKINNNQNLEVVRFSPEGAVKLAPDLNVTFSQPMVSVTSQEEAAQTAPIQISPQPEGKWHWLGTKTLMFDAAKRFRKATKFTARIPAGTKSATGQVLQKDVVWTFTTPPPKVEMMIPNNQVTRRDAIIFISFDQAINPNEVIKTISVSSNGRKIPIRLATQEEIEKDTSVSYYAKQAQPNRWLAFRAVNSDGLIDNALPADAQISVVIEKGTPSAEGPLTTTETQSFSFRTYGAMKFVKSYCGYDENKKTCEPQESFELRFSNPIDEKTFDKSLVKIEPSAEGLRIVPSGNTISVQGYKKGRTTYRVTVSNALKDIFGQTLDKPATAVFNVGAAEANLYSQGGNMVVLDPTAKPVYSIYTTNYANVKVRLYSVQPTDWKQFQEYVRRINYDDRTQKPTIPGKLISDKIVPIENKPDEMVETRIDLSEALNGGFGNVIVDVEPTVKRNNYDRARIFTWAQATEIGLDAFVDNRELVGFATELKTGKPLSGVELSIYPNGKAVSGQRSANDEQRTTNNEQSWFEWLWNWGSSETVAKGPSAVDANGEEIATETIEAAQTNQTGANGILRLPLPDSQAKEQNLLIARRGKDVAFLPENTDYYWQQEGNWYKKPEIDSLRWFVFDDRKMYRPKEEISVKGYIRVYEAGKLGDIAAVADKASGLSYTVYDSRGNEIGKGAANLNAFGAFDFKFKCQIFCRRRTCKRRCKLDSNGDADELHAAESFGLHIWNLDSLVARLRRLQRKRFDADFQRRNRRERETSFEN